MLTPGQEFEELLHPLPLASFLESFGRLPVMVAGSSSKTAPLFDLASFHELVARSSARPRLVQLRAEQEGTAPIDIQPGQLGSMYQMGMLVQVDGLDKFEPRLAAARRSIRLALSLTGAVSVSCLMHPPSSARAFRLDPTSTFVVQLHGANRWSYSTTRALEEPRDRVVLGARGLPAGADFPTPDKMELAEQILTAGDVLYLPPGVWYRSAAQEQGSLHLAFTATSTQFLDLVVNQVLRPRLSRRAEWRYLPIQLAGRELGPRSRAEVQTFLAERLEELRAIVRSEALSPGALLAPLQRLTQEAAPAPGEPAAAVEQEPLEPEDELLVNHTDGLRFTPVPSSVPGDGKVLLYRRDRLVGELPMDTLPFIESLLSKDRFVASSAIEWLPEVDWEEVGSFLNDLVEVGFLSRASR